MLVANNTLHCAWRIDGLPAYSFELALPEVSCPRLMGEARLIAFSRDRDRKVLGEGQHRAVEKLAELEALRRRAFSSLRAALDAVQRVRMDNPGSKLNAARKLESCVVTMPPPPAAHHASGNARAILITHAQDVDGGCWRALSDLGALERGGAVVVVTGSAEPPVADVADGRLEESAAAPSPRKRPRPPPTTSTTASVPTSRAKAVVPASADASTGASRRSSRHDAKAPTGSAGDTGTTSAAALVCATSKDAGAHVGDPPATRRRASAVVASLAHQMLGAEQRASLSAAEQEALLLDVVARGCAEHGISPRPEPADSDSHARDALALQMSMPALE